MKNTRDRKGCRMLDKLKQILKDKGIYAYMIPSADFHGSEYVAEYFREREFLSKFTGSAGTMVITQDEMGLWTDGRYYIQAEQQLEGTGITLFKAGMEGVPTVIEYLAQNMPNDSTFAFDGRVIGMEEGLKLEKKLKDKNIKILYEEDLVDQVWNNRPSLPNEKAYLLDVKYSGKSFSDKLKDLRKTMEYDEVTSHIITTLDDIAWLFNMRGNDIKYSPVVICYTVIEKDQVILFIDETKLSPEIKQEFAKENVLYKPYNAIYDYVKNLSDAVLIDPTKINYSIYKNLPASTKKVTKQNPTILSKSIKNPIEIENIRKSHLRDGVAVTKFIFWLKNNIGKIEITEISAAEKMEEFRREQENFIEPSFETISAYGANAVMAHYSAKPDNCATLQPKGLYLIDSGGQYFDGTTDITRTISLGEVPQKAKQHFTAVLRGMLSLSNAKFLKGVRGINLDILARSPLWELGLDYRHGTGHGIGFLLNVHEPPNGIRWQIVPERNDSCKLEVGMLTSNEPAFYEEGSHGIRIENEIVVQEFQKTEYGQFLHFETMTFVPIDLDAIEAKYMTDQEKGYLNNYHSMVFEKISPYLTEEESIWLKNYTREI
ncbi:peptidase M24 [Candidatus Epulonipiscium fishelsonii]|uniref:Peptidase M24 n=1 Tax=Candidatus Epulonipiscium fishelsonii TaxID=77094 RepID=A0ACC8XCX3_9FIRM|nr:peptidase M24 [Epulopiscium sp. SCG-B11WGA-EpuloA1]ONI41795.1 peptidase M24 [Epulopiscium sp. SCG-B05WGA-EpuloA1]